MKDLSARQRGFTLIDVIVTMLVVLLVLAITIPSVARMNNISNVQMSKSNLITLSVAHTMYAADYNGKQYTLWPDDLTTYGSNFQIALQNYQMALGDAGPGWNSVAIEIGWAPTGNWYLVQPAIGQFNLRQPIGLVAPNPTYGAFRLMYNIPTFNQYLNGRFYDPVLYAPNDTAVMELVEPFFDLPYLPFEAGSAPLYYSSYISSPAALFHPDVFRAPSSGGWQSPWSFMPHGLATLPLNGAKYADLKTHMLEHHWLQNRPDDYCNPLFANGPYNGCQPYFFNHAMASEPATLFYDGHVRLLPNSEVHLSDQQILNQTGGVDGLWSRDTPLGNNGYFNQFAFDNTRLAHHILTTDGILGRDTLGPLSLNARKPHLGRENISTLFR